MPRPTMKRLILPLLLAFGCDDPAPELDPDPGQDDPAPVFDRGGDGTYGGSFRLNTAKLFAEGMPLRHFKRNGLPVVYDNPEHTQVAFQKVRLAAGGGEFAAASNTIEVTEGSLVINGAALLPGQLLGSEWYFSISDSPHPVARPFVMTVVGVAEVDLPGGDTLPVYNFKLNPSTKHYDNGPYSSCAELDALTASNLTWQLADHTPPSILNNFNITYAAVLYGGVRVTEVGAVVNAADMATVACVSGAVGKAGLWGYPPWVTPYLGRSGVQQLQAATRAIRADFCADGTSHTEDGTPIQVRDRYFDQFADPIEATESVWTTNGSVCKVEDDRLESGSTWDCGGALSTTCNQSGADWQNGPDQFMWIKIDPAITTISPRHACTVTGGPGCSDPGIEDTVCASRPSCCTTAWNSVCVSRVTLFSADAKACCTGTGNPGCGDTAVSACVSGYDPSCATSWDGICAVEVENLGCGLCH